ncbi:YihY/virulence factor BrkB family protein [Sphingomonas sp. SM33]|uniref:YihY/virulence factor BrkB family protein n=1 Tax=Sphingomonas telluris TaxID=2907998 RepID=A0ABS9VKT1_9SPHN|nr:YihY/virulence factor BrkB family protein [Sphingomonas telluris]MCH8615576.1 YihY/virulence factor BrkB family protein [Sphingomonas telluris]
MSLKKKKKSGIPDPKGHQATSPWEMPKAAWKDIASRTWQRTWDDNVGLVAAGVAFYGFFALLSLLVMIVLVYGFVADVQTLVDTMHTLTRILPRDVATLIGDQLVQAMKSSEERKGTGLLIAFLVALYGGTNGASAIITALNIAYEEKEKRSLLRFYLIAITMTLAAVMLAVIALTGVTVAASLERVFPLAPDVLVLLGQAIAYVALIFVAAGVAATLYRYGPSREDARWKWITPGSMFTSISWLLLTILFGVWVSTVSDYSATYGPLGATVGLLTWMYLSAYVFCVGAELNSEIEHQTAKDSTTGKPEPLGERGAWAADNVATDDSVQDRPEEAREGEKLTEASPTVADADERR